jgi:acetyl esterase
MAEEHDVELVTADGDKFRCRIYVPRKLSPKEALPVLVFLHGGGWCLCDIETHQNMCRYLCARGDVIGLNVEYRLAPENKFPAGADDCALAVDWVAKNIGPYGGDPARVAVAGASAGGNFSAVLAQRSARGEGPKLRAQLLFYPSLDAANRQTYPSWSRLAPLDFLISDASREWVRDQYFDAPSDIADVRASPMLASDLSGNPPALIITAEYDPLVDEGAAYADRLNEAGCRVEYACYPGVVHGFMSMAGGIPEGYRALDHAADFLRAEMREG